MNITHHKKTGRAIQQIQQENWPVVAVALPPFAKARTKSSSSGSWSVGSEASHQPACAGTRRNYLYVTNELIMDS
jgi:hypothetical protein